MGDNCPSFQLHKHISFMKNTHAHIFTLEQNAYLKSDSKAFCISFREARDENTRGGFPGSIQCLCVNLCLTVVRLMLVFIEF